MFLEMTLVLSMPCGHLSSSLSNMRLGNELEYCTVSTVYCLPKKAKLGFFFYVLYFEFVVQIIIV